MAGLALATEDVWDGNGATIARCGEPLPEARAVRDPIAMARHWRAHMNAERLGEWAARAKPGARLVYGFGTTLNEAAKPDVSALAQQFAERGFALLTSRRRFRRGHGLPGEPAFDHIIERTSRVWHHAGAMDGRARSEPPPLTFLGQGALWRGRPLKLLPIELAVLRALDAKRGQVVATEALAAAGGVKRLSFVETAVRRTRLAIEDVEPVASRVIEGGMLRGYRLTDAVAIGGAR